ncbi:S8 family peptidase [Palleronia caenipelagi]|uniref:S8 family peptidase n=1 Tax=Palleronia caenipelagi TaxID=2489174 RepID=UPI001C8F947C|nr:S8/S53 family peptidase [Palleronia caenipelagi]
MIALSEADQIIGPAMMRDSLGGGVGASPVGGSPNNTTLFSNKVFREARQILSTQVQSEDIGSLIEDSNIAAIWEDPPLQPAHLEIASTSSFDPTVAIGTSADVISLLKCHEFWDDGIKGDNVAIAICDSGVDKDQFPVIDGWAPDGTTPWGEQADSPGGWHGSMVANAALLAAPNAKILDVGVLKYSNLDRGAWLSDALKGMNWISNWMEANPGYRVIVNNSWSTYRRLPSDLDANVRTYADSRLHPFNERLEVIVGDGTPILFAAGNCGSPDPDLRCGSGDTGPDVSVWGAASLDSVLSVAAIDVNGNRLPYSSQGRGSIDPEKPDFSCYSQFKGYMPSVDPGTSTASPVLAGCVALLLSAFPDLKPDVIFNILKASCGAAPNWSSDFGYGTPGSISLRTVLNSVN